MNGTGNLGECPMVPFVLGQEMQVECRGNPCTVEARCECPSGWTGGNDFVDLTGYSCHISTLAMQIMSGVGALLWMKLLLVNVEKIKNLPKRKKGKGLPALYKDGKHLDTFWIVHFCLFLHVLPTLLVSVYRLVFPERSIGKDYLLSVGFMIGQNTSGFWLGTEAQYVQFSVMFDNHRMSSEESQAYVTQFKRLTKRACAIHSCVCVILLVAFCIVQNGTISIDPENYFTVLWIMFLLQTLWLVTFFAMQHLALTRLMKEIKSKLVFSQSQQDVGKHNENSANNNVIIALKTMEHMWTEGKKLLIIIGTVYMIFLIPVCLTYLSYWNAVIVLVTPGDNHFIHSFSASKQSKIVPRSLRRSSLDARRSSLDASRSKFSSTVITSTAGSVTSTAESVPQT